MARIPGPGILSFSRWRWPALLITWWNSRCCGCGIAERGSGRQRMFWLPQLEMQSAWPGLDIILLDEIGIPIRAPGAGTGDRGHGVGADGNAVCDSRAGSFGASAGGVESSGSRARGRRTGTAGLDRAPVLQPPDCRGKNHVATAAAANESAARLAGAGGAEPGADAGNDSGCNRAERACCRTEHKAAGIGRGIDGASRNHGNPGGSGAGAKSSGECEPGDFTEDQ